MRDWLNGRAPPGRTGGFTILEVLIAFTILGIAFVVLLRSFSSSFHAQDTAAEHYMALALAESKIEEFGTLLPLHEGSVAGKADGAMTWTVEIQRFGQNDTAKESAALPLKLYEVRVTVHKADSELVMLQTVKSAYLPQE